MYAIHMDKPIRVWNVPTVAALSLTTAVFLTGAWFNFAEQRAWAEGRGYGMPVLLPIFLDGLALALAVVSMSASLDGRTAIPQRIGSFVAILSSSAVSGTAAYHRMSDVASLTHSRALDWSVVALGGAIPLLCFMAYENVLAELRRLIMKLRGQVSPQPIPKPRAVMWIVQPPWRTFAEWRTGALEQCRAELVVVQARVTEDPQVPPPIEPPMMIEASETVTRTVRRSVTSGMDPLAAGVQVLREHGADVGVTRFRTEVRALGASCPNDKAAELLAQARTEVQP